MQRFRDGRVFKAHRLCVSLNSRLESNKEKRREGKYETLIELERSILSFIISLMAVSTWLGFRVWLQDSGVKRGCNPILELRNQISGTRHLNVIQKEAWLFCRTSSGDRLCWELEEPKGPKRTSQFRRGGHEVGRKGRVPREQL